MSGKVESEALLRHSKSNAHAWAGQELLEMPHFPALPLESLGGKALE